MPEYDVVGCAAPARFERANASVKEMCLKPLDDGAKRSKFIPNNNKSILLKDSIIIRLFFEQRTWELTNHNRNDYDRTRTCDLESALAN